MIITKRFLSFILKYKIVGLREVIQNYFNTFQNNIKFVARAKRFLA